ncbi:MAG: endonuclease VIII [Gammaproteobacteria bacterium]|nr:endonuclease VIII [Gammaproteobacteria bacterium]
MPEGPEIRLAADRIAGALVGHKIVAAKLSPAHLRKFEKRLVGSTVTAVDTRGKAMLTRFDNGLSLFTHNQLYGRWYTTRRPTLPNTKRQLRVALHTQERSALLYSASSIEVLTRKEIAGHAFLNRLGPDILDRELDVDAIAQRLVDSKFGNRALGSLYLQQAFLAGNGNYLRSEILWAAGANPWARPAALDKATIRSVAQQTLTISRRSYRTRGVTATPKETRERKAQGQQYGEYRFQVFGREGLPCYRCGSSIERHSMSSRNLFVCPKCQQC